MTTMTSKAVAEELGYSQKTVEELARNREIPATKLGKSWIFHKEELDEYIRNKCKQNVVEIADTHHILDKYNAV